MFRDHPKYMNTGINAKINGTITEKPKPMLRIIAVYFLWFHPMV